ncbi:MAG TPA: S-layer homology domain-containing protein [Thermoanaerobaculia bacterium]|jgi:hypothetical protein|nr:S-layer homology domain-containing protein [Thermoanaerobaculia bacterium]
MSSVGFRAWIALASGLALGSSVLAQPSHRATAGPGVHLETAPKTPEWGTGGVTYYSLGAAEFLPKASSSAYGTFTSPAGRFATGSGTVFQATPHLPGGALLTYLEFDFCDSDLNDSLSLNLSDCDYLGSCINPPMASITTPLSSNACSVYMWTDLTPLNYTVNNTSRRLLLEVYTGTGSIDKTFYGAVMGYKLQVSQPPGTPTFNDVPVADFGYQYIEALAASGITGGCGSNDFCPDSPVTRRQMAIFIAKALGLSWSGY